MIAQTLVRASPLIRATSTPALQAFRRQASSLSPRPAQAPYRFPLPVEAYPIVGIVIGVGVWLGFSITKHIYQDRDHLRWAPGMGGVKFEMKEDVPASTAL